MSLISSFLWRTLTNTVVKVFDVRIRRPKFGFLTHLKSQTCRYMPTYSQWWKAETRGYQWELLQDQSSLGSYSSQLMNSMFSERPFFKT